MSSKTNYENLANAIVLQAVKDYRVALKCLKMNPGNRNAAADKWEIEKFFRSRWFQELTSIDGEMLIGSLNSEVEK